MDEASSKYSADLPEGPDKEYIQALQQHVKLGIPEHQKLAPRKLFPAPKLPAPPAPVSERWDLSELQDFLATCLHRAYGTNFPHADEVLANFRNHLVDGGRLRHLDDGDWQKLCPYSGPRTLLREQLKNAQSTNPLPAQLKICRSTTMGEHQLAGPQGVHLPASSLGVPPETSVRPSLVSYIASQNPEIPSPHTPTEQRRPGEHEISFKMLCQRSRFSNQRLIDTQWQPDASRSFAVQMLQLIYYMLLRIIFTIRIVKKFGLLATQIPYYCLPLGAVAVCIHFGWEAYYAPTLYTSIVVLPLAFSVNAAYTRREQALQFLAQSQASAVALHLFAECWVGTQLELPPNFVGDMDKLTKGMFVTTGHYLTAINEDDKKVLLENLFVIFLDLFHHVDLIRLSGLPAPLITVPFNHAINLLHSFERLRIFADYRTPCTIRSYTKACLFLLSFALAPFFAGLSVKYGCAYGYILCAVFFWLLVCLDTIQTMLENPYLTFGRTRYEDDVNLSNLRQLPRRHRSFKDTRHSGFKNDEEVLLAPQYLSDKDA